jgi:hypothetical protein
MTSEVKKIDIIDYSCWKIKRNVPRINDELYTFPDLKYVKATTYNNFDEIKGGNVIYDKERFVLEDKYSKPNFVNNHKISSSIYKDPMNSVKFVNERKFQKNNLENTLTFLQDTNELREYFLGTILKKQNRNYYNSKWNVY